MKSSNCTILKERSICEGGIGKKVYVNGFAMI
jgi:hypothetical protein